MEIELKKLGEITTGNTPSKKDGSYWDSEDICFVKPDRIADEGITLINDSSEYISENARSKARVVSKDAVFVTCIGSIGKIGIASSGDYAFNQQINVIEPNKKVLPRYLAYNLLYSKPRLEAIANAPVVPIINKTQFGDFKLNIEEDIAKQAEIVSVLDKLTGIIESRKKELESFDELIKARFVEMFGDETNPYNWPVVNVEEVANVSVGVVIKPAQYYTNAEHGVKAFRSLNIGPMTIKDGDWVYFSREGNVKNVKSQLKENDLLIVRSGAPGTACVVPKQYEGCNAIDIIIARPNTERINPYYLCTYTNMPHGKRQIEEGIGGAAQQHFNVGKYNKLRLMLPPMDLQKEFVEFVAQVDKSKVAVQKSLDETQLLFNSLMQKYFG